MAATLAGIIWGAEFRKRVHGSQFGDECVVCGRRTKDTAKTAYIYASPATGLPVLASEAAAAPAEHEVSGYPVGSDCLRRTPALKPCLQPTPEGN